MKKLLSFLIIIFTIMVNINAQDKIFTREKVVMDFVKYAFTNKKKDIKSAIKLFDLSPSSSADKNKEIMFKEAFCELGKQNPDLISSKIQEFHYSDYDTFPGKKIQFGFDKDVKKPIGILLKNNKPVLYFLFNDENKIMSFHYAQKGIEGPAYFILYD